MRYETKYAYYPIKGNLTKSLFSSQFSWDRWLFYSKIIFLLHLVSCDEPGIKSFRYWKAESFYPRAKPVCPLMAEAIARPVNSVVR